MVYKRQVPSYFKQPDPEKIITMQLSSSRHQSPGTAYILSTVPRLNIQRQQNTLHKCSTSPSLRDRCDMANTRCRRTPAASAAQSSQKVRIYTKGDQSPVEKIASSLASAFEDDPLLLYNYGSNEPDVLSKHKRLMMSALNYELSRPQGETTVHVSEDDSTVAVWHHVNHWKTPFIHQILSLVSLFRAIGWSAIRFFDTASRIEHFHPTEPHMHLFIIGTHADMQGKGTGSVVLSEMLQYCDSNSIPVYVESSNERNLPFYAKHGFKIMKKIPDLPQDCPPVHALWRDPKQVNDKVTSQQSLCTRLPRNSLTN